MLYKNLTIFCFFILFSTSIYSNEQSEIAITLPDFGGKISTKMQSDSNKKEAVKQYIIDAFKVLTAVVEAIGFVEVTTIIHEYAHGLALMAVDENASFDVSMNVNDKTKNPIFQFYNLKFYGDLTPMSWVHFKNAKNTDKYENIFVSAAGPMAQIACCYLTLFYKAFKSDYAITKDFVKSFKNAFKKTFTPFENLKNRKKLSKAEVVSELIFLYLVVGLAFSQFAYGGFPILGLGDGTKVWRKLLGKRDISYMGPTGFTILMSGCALVLLIKSLKVYKEYFNEIKNEKPTEILDKQTLVIA